MNNVIFISGIDTGCGKTYVTGLLANYFRNAGVNVITQKLVQTGCKDIAEDLLEHRCLMGCSTFPEDEEGITCPYVFGFPASPHLASKLENRTVDINTLMNSTNILSERYELVLIEGAGGLHVPLNNCMLTIDYIKQQDYPLILVASSKLGSINHTLLSLESCQNHHLKLSALVYNRVPGSNEIIAEDTCNILRDYVSIKYPDVNFFELTELQKTESLQKLLKIKTNKLLKSII